MKYKCVSEQVEQDCESLDITIEKDCDIKVKSEAVESCKSNPNENDKETRKSGNGGCAGPLAGY